MVFKEVREEVCRRGGAATSRLLLWTFAVIKPKGSFLFCANTLF